MIQCILRLIIITVEWNRAVLRIVWNFFQINYAWWLSGNDRLVNSVSVSATVTAKCNTQSIGLKVHSRVSWLMWPLMSRNSRENADSYNSKLKRKVSAVFSESETYHACHGNRSPLSDDYNVLREGARSPWWESAPHTMIKERAAIDSVVTCST